MIQRPGFPDPPTFIVHADWGSNPKKRWMAWATREENYLVHPTQPVGDLANFLQRIKTQANPAGSILIGFDFPIGLPFAYAQKAGIHNFIYALPRFGQDEWGEFFDVAQSAEQISLARPFYPFRPGGTRQQYLLDRLDIPTIEDLRRLCEKAPPLRRSAAPIFWTLGAQQVGKAAINGWKQVIIPGLNNPNLDLQVWPFSGRMIDLIQPGKLIIAETYPAEYLHQLKLFDPHTRFSKRRQNDRVIAAEMLIKYAVSRSIKFHPELEMSLQDGFGDDRAGEDRFDAVVGLFGMLQFFTGVRNLFEPVPEQIRLIEGWILGLSSE
jgi:hypothetical protein